jgi:hypothetical protein
LAAALMAPAIVGLDCGVSGFLGRSECGRARRRGPKVPKIPSAVLHAAAAINQDTKALVLNDDVQPEHLCSLFGRTILAS